jgi:uncharacterized protein with ATP-grasp and redox domains
MRHAKVPVEQQPEILYELMDLVKTFDMENTPCFNSTSSILKTYELSKNKDPFKDEKQTSNEKAMDILKSILRHHTDDTPDLHWLIKLSSAGNIIDTGIMFEYDIENTIEDTMKKGFSIDHYDDFAKVLESSETVLYITDNCGEIVFDAPVVRYLSTLGKRIYASVKSAPILNDAMREDAVFAGIDNYAEIIETGSGYLGVNPDDSSDEFMNLLNNCDLVISKGQANFESLNDYSGAKGRIFFILKVKCERVADIIPGSMYGDSVFINAEKGSNR